MNPDFLDMLSALLEAEAEFIVVGAHALAAHGHPRATGDLDILVRPEADNARRVMNAIREFGAPIHDLTIADLSSDNTVFQIGVVPVRIDLLTSISGVTFDEAWRGRKGISVGGLEVHCIGRNELIANKRAAGRDQDLLDIQTLQKHPEVPGSN